MQKVSVFWLSRPDSRLVSCLYKIRQSIALRFELEENTRVVNLKKLKGGAKHEIISQPLGKIYLTYLIDKKIIYVLHKLHYKSHVRILS